MSPWLKFSLVKKSKQSWDQTPVVAQHMIQAALFGLLEKQVNSGKLKYWMNSLNS
jgi:hypothetical protein